MSLTSTSVGSMPDCRCSSSCGQQHGGFHRVSTPARTPARSTTPGVAGSPPWLTRASVNLYLPAPAVIIGGVAAAASLGRGDAQRRRNANKAGLEEGALPLTQRLAKPASSGPLGQPPGCLYLAALPRASQLRWCKSSSRSVG